MQFRTIYNPEATPFILSPEKPVVMLGSCFADNMVKRMQYSLWNAQNPTGTLYNPESIARILENLILSDNWHAEAEESIFEDAGGVFHSFLFDSKVSARSAGECLRKIAEIRESMKTLLSHANALFITFGTSICYKLISSSPYSPIKTPSYIVSNCHKQPAGMFERFRLSVDEIADRWINLCEKIKTLYPQLEIIFTVSPVRHLKDGFIGNMRSKAILLLATEKIANKVSYCHYFPAYEIINDDLRDYRFYAYDLTHPSQEAIEYIWEIFKDTFLDQAGKELLKEGEKIFKGYCHRPLIATEEEKSEYKKKMEKRILDFLNLHPLMSNPPLTKT